MKFEIRKTVGEGLEVVPRGLVLIATDERESQMIDEALGDKVIDDDGLIAKGTFEVRLSDGYGEHYIYLETPQDRDT